MTAENPELVRVLDGHAYNCTETYEGGRTAYAPTVASLSADDSSVTLSLDVSFRLCVRDGDSVSWQSRRPLDPIDSFDADGNPVRTSFRQPELVLADADLVRTQPAALGNELTERVEYRFQPADLLSPQDVADLASGKPVRARLSLLYRSIATAFTVRGEVPLGYQFGGTYTLFFTLQR
jgi:hypothetical protein